MRAKISRWGKSLGVRLPKAVIKAAGLREGDIVDLVVRPSGVDIVRGGAVRPSLSELVAEMERLGPANRPRFENWSILPTEDWTDIAPPHKA